jgi:hypothetical protein
MRLFHGYNEIEKKLLEMYSKMFTEMGLPEARKMAKELLDAAIEESKREVTYNLPPNFGDMLLEKEKTDEKIRKMLEKKRKEGVRDEDIGWWWNMNDVERRMMIKVDEFFLPSAHIKLREEGKTSDEAAAQVRKTHPIYGDPEDTTHGSGDDRPLPFELKDRVNIYIQKRFLNDREKFGKDIDSSSTFNALVRREIRAGNL